MELDSLTAFKAEVAGWLENCDARLLPVSPPGYVRLHALADTTKKRLYLRTACEELYRRYCRRSGGDPGGVDVAKWWQRYGAEPRSGASDIVDAIHEWTGTLQLEPWPGVHVVGPTSERPVSAVEIVCGKDDYEMVKAEWEKVKQMAGAVPVLITPHD